MPGASYARLPTEREANAAAAAYAARSLGRAELARLAAVPELADLLAAEPPDDVVGETHALLGEEVVVGRERLERAGRGVIEVVAPIVALSAGMP